MTISTTSADFFERKYSAHQDPWNFATSPYERHRYETILRAIGNQRYRRALEPGCSVGILTAGLASVCDEVEAFDIAPSAVAAAQERCQHMRNVHISCQALSESSTKGEFDLIALCEIGYYFESAVLHRIALRMADHLSPQGVLVSAHWLGTSSDHLLSGDAVHATLRATFQSQGLILEHAERHPEFRLDQWRKKPSCTARQVAV